MKYLLPVIAMLGLSACTGVPHTSSNPGLYSVPVGSVLKLNQPLTIPSRKARTGIQFGKPARGVDKWQPYCEMVVNTLSNDSATIVPGDYRVTRVRRAQIPYAGSQPNGGNMLAATATDGFMLAQSPSYAWLYMTTMRLESTAYPDIRQIECGAVFGTGYEARHMTVQEFENAVGNVITLMLADTAS